MARDGRVIARGSQDSLTRGLPGELRLRFDGDASGACLPPDLAARARRADGEVRIASASPPADLAAALAAGCAPAWVDVRRPDLDDLYRSLSRAVPHGAADDREVLHVA